MHWLPIVNKKSSPLEMERAVIVCAEKISNGNVDLMREISAHLSPIIREGGHFPYHSIINATIFYFTGKLKKAERLIKKIKCEAWLSEDIQGWLAVVRGSNLRSLGEFDKAVKYLLIGKKMIPGQSKLVAFKAFSDYHLGSILAILEEYDGAEKHFIEAYKLSKKIENDTVIYRCSLGLGAFYSKIKKTEKANSFLTEALDLAGTNPGAQANVYYELANYFLEKNDTRKALDMCEKAIFLRKSEGMLDALNTVNILKAKILVREGELINAVSLCTVTLKKVREFKTQLKERDCLELLADAHEKLHNHQEALRYLRGFNNLQFNILNNQYKKILKKRY